MLIGKIEMLKVICRFCLNNKDVTNQNKSQSSWDDDLYTWGREKKFMFWKAWNLYGALSFVILGLGCNFLMWSIMKILKP